MNAVRALSVQSHVLWSDECASNVSERHEQFVPTYIGKHVLVYMDDILVFSKNDAEHIGHLRDVLITLRKN